MTLNFIYIFGTFRFMRLPKFPRAKVQISYTFLAHFDLCTCQSFPGQKCRFHIHFWHISIYAPAKVSQGKSADFIYIFGTFRFMLLPKFPRAKVQVSYTFLAHFNLCTCQSFPGQNCRFHIHFWHISIYAPAKVSQVTFQFLFQPTFPRSKMQISHTFLAHFNLCASQVPRSKMQISYTV